MAAVQLSPDDAVAFFAKHKLDELTVAAVNAKGSVTVSGPSEQILTLKEVMKAERVVGQVLDINYPFHHPLIEIAKDDFLDDMSQIALRPSQVPFISTVTGDVLAGDKLDPGYWWSNVREPVHFLQATNTALDLGCTLFVEIGPRPILTSYLKDTVKDRSVAAAAISSLLREESSRRSGVDDIRACHRQWRSIRPAQGVRRSERTYRAAFPAVRTDRYAARIHQ